MSEPKTYVREDAHGALRVGKTRVSLDSVVLSFQEGHSAEAIRGQYPALSLEEVYGAIAYYLANREQVEAYLQRQQQLWNEGKTESDATNAAVVKRLQALKKSTRQEQA